jgi:hypothetical protein
MFGTMKKLKAEIDGLHALLEQSRVRLQRDFEQVSCRFLDSAGDLGLVECGFFCEGWGVGGPFTLIYIHIFFWNP